jgi:uncharacterized phage protein gp47/JayE
MAFDRPSLAALITRIEADFVSRLELEGALLRRAVVRVLARVVAGATHMLHGHLEYVARQIFPDLSDDAFLVRQAALYGLAKTSPGYAQATLDLTGTDTSVVPEGTIFLRADGVEYETDAEVEIGDGFPTGTAEVDVTAVLAGEDGTLTAGVVLTLESPIAGVDSSATVAESLTDGSDEETTDELRVRLLARLDEPPHGGTSADYVAWAKEVSGVTRVWVDPGGLGAGTVVVRFVRDNDASPIPDAGEVSDVQDKLDEEAPAHATPTAVAPTALARDFTITIDPDTSDIRDAVEAELEDLLLREGEPGGTILLSAIRTAIGTSAGVEDYTLTSPVADVTHTANQIPTMGVITWT